tara:strand:+ start:52 stop:234 length:183 start_codon:yes stop_codon:yes gene_type:complete
MPHPYPIHEDQEGKEKSHTGHEKLQAHNQLTSIQTVAKDASPGTHKQRGKRVDGTYRDYQ